MKRTLVLALSLVAAAVLLRYGIAPLATQLPDNYASELQFVVEDRFRASLNNPWETNTFIAARTDQTLSNVGRVAIIQGALDWNTESGELIFENLGLYGVDRRTRSILSGYGDVERAGQFLFPLHVGQTIYTYWDPMFIGQRTATFDHTETLDGLQVHVFSFSGPNMDETAGYAYLPDVPERYLTRTDGEGTLSIELLSGIVVDYQEQGVSYFIDPTSGARLPEAEFQIWSDSYTPETRAAQLTLARAERLRILALESWLPSALLALGFILFAGKLWLVTRAKVTLARQGRDLAPLQVLKDKEPA
jgi:hypothetical protein